jgi:uncharacterized integral membrane protein
MLDENTSKRVKLISLCVVLLMFGVFLGKNYTPTAVWIFFWTPTVPLIVIALFCFLLGGFCGWALTYFMKKRIDF